MCMSCIYACVSPYVAKCERDQRGQRPRVWLQFELTCEINQHSRRSYSLFASGFVVETPEYRSVDTTNDGRFTTLTAHHPRYATWIPNILGYLMYFRIWLHQIDMGIWETLDEMCVNNINITSLTFWAIERVWLTQDISNYRWRSCVCMSGSSGDSNLI